MDTLVWNRFPGPGYPVNVAIATGKIKEFDVVWKVVTASIYK